MNRELLITLGFLAAEIAILALCYARAKQPVNPIKPRLIPYAPVMLFLGLAIVVTAAHTVSVVTGHRLEARNKTPGGMNRGSGGY